MLQYVHQMACFSPEGDVQGAAVSRTEEVGELSSKMDLLYGNERLSSE